MRVYGKTCKKRLPYNIDPERGKEEKERSPWIKSLGRVYYRIHARVSQILSIVVYFPIVLLFFLMFSSAYPDATLPLGAALAISMIITIAASICR